MRRHTVGAKARRVTQALNHPCHERSDVQLTHLLWDADISIDKWLIVDNHVLVFLSGALLKRVCRATE